MKQDKQEQARHLYFAQAKTQKEIARILDVSEKTIYNWIKRHSWDQLRQAARQAPALITENICSQLAELQNSIARREPGLRYANKEESQIMLRLITMLEKMKKFPGLAMNMQVMTTFSNWASTRDEAFTRDLSLYSSLFLQGYAKNGYHPYEMEFGIEKISPIDPYYEEGPIDESPEPTEKISVSLPNDVIVSLSNNEQQCHPEPVEGPVITPTQPSQTIENQASYSCHPELAEGPPPVKTGKKPVNPPAENHDCSSKNGQDSQRNSQPPKSQIHDSPLGGGGVPDGTNDYPWRKWLPELLQQKQADKTSGNSNSSEKNTR